MNYFIHYLSTTPNTQKNMSTILLETSAKSFDMTTLENLDANILRKIIQMMQLEHSQQIQELTEHNEYLAKEITLERKYKNFRTEIEITNLNYKIQSYVEICRVLRERLKSSKKETQELQEEIECLKATVSHHKEKFAYVDRTCTIQWLERVKFLSNEISKEQQKHSLLKENSDNVIAILTEQLRETKKKNSELCTKLHYLENNSKQVHFKFNINAKPFIPSKH